LKEQLQFFNDHWEEMKSSLKSGGGEAVIDYILGFEDLLEMAHRIYEG